MKNSHTITILTIFILVFSLTTIALTSEVSHSVFAAKKNKSEGKSAPDASTSIPSSSLAGSNSGNVGSSLDSLPLPCPDGSIPVKGKCPLPSTIPQEDPEKSKPTTPSTSESRNTDDASDTLLPLPPATSDTNAGGSKHKGSNSDSSSTVTPPLSLPCPDGSIPVKGKCPPPLAAASEDTSITKNKHKSEDKSTPDASTPTVAVGESNSNAGSTTSSKSKEDITNGNAKRVDSSTDGSTTTPTLPTGPGSSNQDSSITPPPPPPPTTSDGGNIDSSKDSGEDSSSSNNTPLPSIIPSNQGAGDTDTGSTGAGSSANSGGSSTDTGGGSSSSNSGGSATHPSTTSGGGSSSTSSSSSGTSSSGTTNTKPTNSKKTPQTTVSQSAAIAATNQIINSPGSTILNQQSIKQSFKINNEVNNIIRKNIISQSSSSSTTATTTPREISNLITVKLATTSSTMSRNAYLPIADVAPYHLIGGHVTANLPNNHLNVVVAQLSSSNGAIEHAVVLDMIKSQISNIFETDLGSQISGTNPLTGKQDVVSDITNLFLWNNGNQQVTFVDANAVTMNLIYK